MADLTLMTILVQFIPSIIVILGYLILFGKRRNRFIEAFILVMVVQAVTFFIYNIFVIPSIVPNYFSETVDTDVFIGVLFTDFMFQFGYALQGFFTWIMVSFIAVLFGQLVLLLKLALQDPLKMKFSNLTKRIVGKEPESDGYSGLGDRLQNIRFEGVEPHPLDPEVVKKAYSESWKDYLIIGLATLLPSIGIYMGNYANLYIYAVVVFVTWIYRFGYPASNRIAKGAGITLGDRDLGSEMMRGVLGWFFRLNLLLSLVTIVFDVINAIGTGTLASLGAYYLEGLALAFPPILLVIIVFPIAEDFSVILYKRVFDAIASARSKISLTDWSAVLTNAVSGVLVGGIALAAFLGAVFGATVHYARMHGLGFLFYPSEIDAFVTGAIVSAPTNFEIISPVIWELLMLMIPFGMMILLGLLGHLILDRTNARPLGFAFFSGLFLSVVSYFLMPGLDYTLGGRIIPAEYMGNVFYRIVPLVIAPTELDLLFRLAAEFIINVPLNISVVLFILYYLRYRDRWRESTGEEKGPLLSVQFRDIKDAVLLFVGGIIASIAGILIISVVLDPGYLFSLISSLIIEIGEPNGLELVFAYQVSIFTIVVEHNIIRTLLMLIAGPLFWTVVLWMVGVRSKEEANGNVGWFTLFLIVVTGIASYLWTINDIAAGLIVPSTNPWADPWTFSAHLGYRAAILYGILFGVYFLAIIVNYVSKGSVGVWWLPPIATLFAIEYFVYDDQFTLIALIILPMILALVYYPFKKPEEQGDLLITYIRFSLLSLAIAEILSTALWVAGIATLEFLFTGNIIPYLAQILPHAIIEIPAFLFAAAASFRIARDLEPTIIAEDWSEVPNKTKEILTDSRMWRTYLLVMFFLVIAALIEENISWIIFQYVTQP